MVIVPPDELARHARDGFPERGGGARRVAARAAVARLLWDEGGERRVPPAGTLDRTVSALPRGDLQRMCEFNPFGPVYFIPTPPFLRALARRIRSRGARRVLEVAAGDGHLTRALSAHAPELRVIASDSGKWERPQARMSPRERRELRGTAVAGIRPGSEVVRLDVRAAIDRFQPDLVLACWLPPGPLLGRSCARRTATSSRSAPGAESRATSPAGATSTSSATSSTRSAAAASTSSPRASCTRA